MTREHATVIAIERLMREGTGDPGLTFEVLDGATMQEMYDGEDRSVWIISPLTIVNTDGPHHRAVLVVTVIPDIDGRIVFRCLGVDQEGEPCAYHEG